jgi:hypothetical protein
VRDRHAWLRRLESAERSRSSLSAYRHAIDDLLAWAERVERTGELFEEQATIDYLHEYRTRCNPCTGHLPPPIHFASAVRGVGEPA